MVSTVQWYPIKLTAHIRTYPFGARRIPDQLGKRGLPAGTIAETWEVSDYRDTTGTVTTGAFAGRTLHDLVRSYPDELVGQGWRGPHFPLLLKFLDASHPLPVHLHADDATARQVYGEPNGKTEAWHILWAAPGAEILVGVKPGLARADLAAAFKAQEYAAVMPRFPIAAGDTVYVPAGVLHSFGPDTLIIEIQQTSDLTQTVMPSDLYGNRLPPEQWEANINATLDQLRTHYQPRPHPGLLLRDGANRYRMGCAGPYFALEHWTLTQPHTEPAHPWRGLTLSCIAGGVQIAHAGGSEHLAQGESCLLPAALGAVQIVPETTAELIACYVPDLERDILAPLRAGGHSDAAIRTLGEVP